MKKYIGIDLGGTHVRAAVVNEAYEIEDILHEDTRRESVLEQLGELICRLKTGRDINGTGIGVPGAIDLEGKVRYSSNLPRLEGSLLREEVFRLTGERTVVINDCNAAALAEAYLGTGRGYRSVYYVTISTGIGGGFVYDGKVMTGAGGFAGEVGGIIVEQEAKESFRGLYPGAAESMAGGDALIHWGSRALGRNLSHAGEVFDAARRGDEWAVKLTGRMARDLAILFAGISYVINPDIFVLGGGCMQGQDCFLEPMKKEYMAMTPPGLHTTIFAPAKLAEPGMLGAAIAGMINQADT